MKDVLNNVQTRLLVQIIIVLLNPKSGVSCVH